LFSDERFNKLVAKCFHFYFQKIKIFAKIKKK